MDQKKIFPWLSFETLKLKLKEILEIQIYQTKRKGEKKKKSNMGGLNGVNGPSGFENQWDTSRVFQYARALGEERINRAK